MLQRSATGPPPYKVAVIEDDASIRNLYRLKLELEGYTVETAEDGMQGCRLIKNFQPHLVLLDLFMPHMNGDEMLQKVREHEWGADVRVIVLTNISRDEAPAALRFLNVDRYVVKAHYTPSQVVDIVREVLHLP